MAFLGKVGNILRQSASKQVNTDFSATKSFIYQTIRCMSSSKIFVGGGSRLLFELTISELILPFNIEFFGCSCAGLSYGTDQQGLTEAFAKYGEVIEGSAFLYFS